MIRRASRPVFVVGSIASEIDLEEKKLIDYVIRLARQFQIRVIATGSTNTAFLARDFTPDAVMPAVDAGFRLADPAGRESMATALMISQSLSAFPTRWVLPSSQA